MTVSLLIWFVVVGLCCLGTFSSVYKAVDTYHDRYRNDEWKKILFEPSNKRENETGRPEPFYVAVKRIYVTSSPDRIRNEIEILRDLG